MKNLIRLMCLVMAVAATPSFAASNRGQDVDVTSRTKISGMINGSPLKVDVLSRFNTGRGGTSSCEFKELPTGFNPGTLGTHA